MAAAALLGYFGITFGYSDVNRRQIRSAAPFWDGAVQTYCAGGHEQLQAYWDRRCAADLCVGHLGLWLFHPASGGVDPADVLESYAARRCR